MYEQNTYFRSLPNPPLESAIPGSKKRRQSPFGPGQNKDADNVFHFSCPDVLSNSIIRTLSPPRPEEKSQGKNKNKNNKSNNIRLILTYLLTSYSNSNSIPKATRPYLQKAIRDLIPFLEVVFRSPKNREILAYLIENKAATYQTLKNDTGIHKATIYYCLNGLADLGLLDFRIIEDSIEGEKFKDGGKRPQVYFYVDANTEDIEKAIDEHYKIMAKKKQERKERKIMLFRDRYIEQAKDRIIRGADPGYVKRWLYDDKGFSSEEADKIVNDFVKKHRY